MYIVKGLYKCYFIIDILTMWTWGSQMHRNVEKRVFKYIYLINDALKQSSFQRVLGWLSDWVRLFQWDLVVLEKLDLLGA